MKALAMATMLGVTTAIAAPTDRPVRDQVLDTISRRLDSSARNDTAAWARFVDDDLLAPLEGQSSSKQAWLASHKAQPREVQYWYGPLEDPKVRIHGDTAVASYHARQFTRIGGQTTFVHKWQIETLIRRDGRWLLVSVADGLIPPEPESIAVDATTLDSYVGDYEWAPTLVSKIRRHERTLHEEFPGQGTAELAAQSVTTFFIKGEAASGSSSRIVFVTDKDGRVTHYLYREPGATDRIVKKIR